MVNPRGNHRKDDDDNKLPKSTFASCRKYLGVQRIVFVRKVFVVKMFISVKKGGAYSAQQQAVLPLSLPCLSGHSEVKISKISEDTFTRDSIGCVRHTNGRRT
jgi:hypothetical protein